MGTANQIEQELMNYISDHKIRNTHSSSAGTGDGGF